MEKLTIEVTKMTADALRKVAGELQVPIGEVVDRYALRVAPDNPDNAFILAMEHYLVCVSRLSKEDSAQVYGDMCGVFLGSIPTEELDKMVSDLRSKRKNPTPFDEEEQAAFKKAVDNMVESAKSKYIQQVFYSLLHG